MFIITCVIFYLSCTESASAPLTIIDIFKNIENNTNSEQLIKEEIVTPKYEPPAQPIATTAKVPQITVIEDPIDLCPTLEPNMDHLTQEAFMVKLTHPCRYDKLMKPPSEGPIPVYVQIDLQYVEAVEQLQFRAHMLVQYLYHDSRLRFGHISYNRGYILGEEVLRDRIWVPHMLIQNDRDTAIMGIDNKDIFVSINPNGDVVYSYRMATTFYCWMNLQKFPFDSQDCYLRWNSWTYNTSNLVLRWDREKPVQIAKNLHLTEFVLSGTYTSEGEKEAAFSRGSLVGQFSELTFKFKLTREVGYYIMDYYLPSMLLVIISWVTFWLQADAAPPRVTLGNKIVEFVELPEELSLKRTKMHRLADEILGTSTMLAFITLNGGLSKNLPKVSYIKANEIWFLACACFIFCSMAEFAFVNVIWRRKKKVELKKQSSKHILKGALTPSLARKQLRKAESIHSLYKTRSCSSLDGVNGDSNNRDQTQNNYLTVHGFPNLNVPTITTQHSQDELLERQDSVTTIHVPENNPDDPLTWHTMTPQEVAIWIDKKSRIVFPLTFLIFNIFYWSFVYLL